MAKNIAKEERIKALVAELLADEEAEGFDAQNENINDIEDAMVRIGDLRGPLKWAYRWKLARQYTGEVRESIRRVRIAASRESVWGSMPATDHPAGERFLWPRRSIAAPKCRRHFFPLRRTDWELRPATTTRHAHVPLHRVRRAAGSQLWRGGGVALRTGRNSRCFPGVFGGPPNGSVRSAVAEARQAAVEYGQLPLPARSDKSPVEQVPCKWSACRMDGGRFQLRERLAAELDTSGDGIQRRRCFWREYKAGVLLLQHERAKSTRKDHLSGPSRDVRRSGEKCGKSLINQRRGFTSDSQVSIKADEAAGPDFKERVGRPETLVKSCVVATSGDVDAFGPLLARAAYDRGLFHAASAESVCRRRLADKLGSVRRRYFLPLMCRFSDFVHAADVRLCRRDDGPQRERRLVGLSRLVAMALEGRGPPLARRTGEAAAGARRPRTERNSTPRAQVANSLAYLTNQRERMKYDQYRKQGLPITSSPIESTVKQINRRIKGTEKFWDEGADPMLHLVADRLSQTNAVTKFWSRRLDRLIQSSSYHQAT